MPTHNPQPSEDSIFSFNDVSYSKPSTSPLINQLYSDANEFGNVLVNSGCDQVHQDDGFNDLVARDLSNSERAIVDHSKKFTAARNSWMSTRDADPDNSAASITEDDKSEATISSVEAALSHSTPRRSSSQDSDVSIKLEPDQIVSILIEEFGSLATDDSEEKLIMEADGCFLYDVAVIGVIHLTTRRLAFHASLLATRPDLAPSYGAIKAGPATLHRKGWHSKRRVWMELSQDMLCTYASSTDESKTKPLYTLLLTLVRDVVPVDGKHPRYMRLVLDDMSNNENDYIEFDTEESAHDWRKEITGMDTVIRDTYAGDAPDAEAGIRVSCPLSRIDGYQTGTLPQFPSIVSLKIPLVSSEINANESPDANSLVVDIQEFQIGPVKPNPLWDKLGDFMTQAKALTKAESNERFSPVVVDFGPFNFFETGPKGSAEQCGEPQECVIRAALGLAHEAPIWYARARIYRTVTTSGYFVISPAYVGFWSKSMAGRDLRYRFPISTITHIEPFHLNWFNVDAMSLGTEEQADMRFVFKAISHRDEAISKIQGLMNHTNVFPATTPFTSPSGSGATTPLSSSSHSQPSLPPPSDHLASPTRSATTLLAPLARSVAAATAAAAEIPLEIRQRMPKIINLPRQLIVTHKRLHVICLTIGSRGDVQPYIALGLGLIKEGHRVTIVTHQEYKEWIEKFGIEHRQAGGDPGALMKLSVDHKMFSPEFFKQSLTTFRPWLDELLRDAWEACKDADVLLESPPAMAGVHIAEALGIPYFRTFTMPWTKTTDFPHAFLSPPVDSPTFNSASNVFWVASSFQINRWRRQTLKIGNTDMGHMAQAKIPFIYNFSPAVVPKPLDWPDTTVISGYWFLDKADHDWSPPQSLMDWMARARKDQKPVVYIGFGSITVPHPNRTTTRIVDAVLQSGVRAIISKGWSSRMNKSNENEPEVDIPSECYMLDKVPHDWLFPQIDAALHHGGAGTTGASLRAGIPTLIKPWFGDQFFWASRVQRIGVASLRVNDLSEALIKATANRLMKDKARLIGERIRAEDGVHTAIYTINTYLGRASRGRAIHEN
ncbi:glycosyltransferase family 1 protein [Cyathus striatus]|nr:glycosyltransferase family 1 protein [Cyathus striatus]